MATIARALRPLRRELDKTRQAVPDIQGEFLTTEDLSTCISSLELFYDTLRAQLNSFKEVQVQYLQTVWTSDADAKTAAEQAEADSELLTAVDKVLVEIKHHIRVISSQQRSADLNNGNTAGRSNISTPATTTKLPKLTFPTFNGDILQWQSFWDRFQVTIDNNNLLSDVDKFTFLVGQLMGDAAITVSGLALTSANYKVALDLLKDKYGNTDIIIDSHYVALSEVPQAQTARSVRQTFDKLETHLNALEALGEDINHRQFFTLIRSKLPPSLIIQMEKEKVGSEEGWTVTTLRRFLRSHIQICEAAYNKISQSSEMCINSGNNKQSSGARKPNARFQSSTNALLGKSQHRGRGGPFLKGSVVASSVLNTNVVLKRECPYCGRPGHFADMCTEVTASAARKEILRDQRRCYICLGMGHAASTCKRSRPCFHCKLANKHHSSICPERNQSTQVTVAKATNSVVSNNAASITSNLLATNEVSLLQTLTARFLTADNKWIEAKGIMDNGSNRSYITQFLADKIRPSIEKAGQPLSVQTFGSDETNEVPSKICRVNLQQTDGSLTPLLVNIVPTITGKMSRTKVNPQDVFQYVHNFKLADSLPAHPEHFVVDFLIGADFMWDFLTGEKVSLPNGLYLINSSLGWLLGGRLLTKNAIQPGLTSLLSRSCDEKNPKLPEGLGGDLSFLWDLETVGITDQPDNPEDEIALKSFNETIRYNAEEKRYYVTWPWKSPDIDLSSNYAVALGRLNSLLRKYKATPEIFLHYDKVLSDQLERGVIEKATKTTSASNRTYYVPHHAVITPGKTTKLRIVYDASSKANKDLKSLNECLYRGPVFLDDVAAVLIRFRTYPIALVSDIEKAFLQVGLQESERDVTRLLWLKNPSLLTTDNNIQIYRHKRVSFGMISSPFLLSATVIHHLKSIGGPIADLILENIYVDNIIMGTATEENAKEIYTSTKKMFQEASMNVREWMTNSAAVLQSIPPEDRAQGNMKVLGTPWDPISDTLSVATSKKVVKAQDPNSVTKRLMLQYLASFFDPLGFICPATLQGKILLQQLWESKLDWDSPLPEEIQSQWNAFIHEMPHLQTITIPRFIGTSNYAELHCFCDASSKAYGICVYLRINIDSRHQAKLIFAKARMAPIRQTMTIPRLELLAVHIGVKSLNFVKKALNVEVTRQVIWTDSQCVLHWLGSEKPLTVFVRNRIKDIKQFPEINCRFTPTDQNPADIASRGLQPKELEKSDLWWYGPGFLIDSTEESWPQFQPRINGESILEEQLKATVTLPVPDAETITMGAIDAHRYSSLAKLYRVTAWVLRYIRNLTGTKTQGPLSTEELLTAKNKWILWIQTEAYPDVLTALKSKKRHPLIQQLGLWIDDQGVIRCGGRLLNSQLQEEAMYPKLLPKNHYVVNLIVDSTHKRLYHAGVAHTLAQIRQEFWIPAGRSLVYQRIKACHNCRKFDGGPYKSPPIPPLPTDRVQPSASFTATGLDYLGPVFVKQKDEQIKAWICLFTCLSTRAIHLEVVEDMSAEQFLLCVRRFVARRGTPRIIWSDNASQFKSVQRAIIKNHTSSCQPNDDVSNYMSKEAIKWKFIPERAPWMGGFYERLVRSVKQCLKKSLGRTCLTSSQLNTVITEIEAVLNSRPMVYVHADHSDATTLTPSHFLSLNPRTSLPHSNLDDLSDPDFITMMSTKQTLLDTWKKGQQHLEAFWRMWRDQYLLSLREHSHKSVQGSYRRPTLKPELGHIVQIKADGPRGSWITGQIIKLHHGTDQQIRSAQVRTHNSKIFTRSITHLYPLEISTAVPPTTPMDQSTKQPIEEEHTTQPAKKRSQRKAAQQARVRITHQTESSDTKDSEAELLSITQRSPSPRSAHLSSVTNLVILILHLLCMIRPIFSQSGVTPLLCNAGEAKITFDLSSRRGCAPINTAGDETVYDASVIIFKSNIAKYESEAWKCKKVVTTIETWTEFAKWNLFNNPIGTQEIPVPENECHMMIQEKKCLEGQLVGGDHFFRTENNLEPEYTTGNAWDCCYWKQQKVTNCLLIKGKVFQTFHGQMESNLGNVAECQYNHKSCALPDMSTVIWKLNATSQCEFVKWKKTKGKMWKTRFLSEDQEIALSWDDNSEKRTTCLGSEAILTDQGVPFVYLKQITEKRVKRTNQPSDDVALRLEALELRLDNFFKENLDLAFNTVCKSTQELHKIALLLAHSEPTLIARHLLQDNQLMGKLRGKYLDIWPCIPVDKYVPLKMKTNCRDGIPMNYTLKGQTGFGYLNPKTSIIYRSAAPSECSLVQEILMQDAIESPWIYLATTGELKPFKGKVIKHPLFTMNLTAVADFKSIIHKPVHMYTLEEYRAKISINDILESIQSQIKIMDEVNSIGQGGKPISSDATNLVQRINQYTPFGFLSSLGHKILQIWIYSCCAWITYSFLWTFLLSRLQAQLQTIWNNRVIQETDDPMTHIPIMRMKKPE